MISFDEFKKVDLRVGAILEAERVEGADKLLKLSVDIGEEEPRQVVAGIREHVDETKNLIDTQVVIVANLEPREIFGVESQGMLLAAQDKKSIVLISPRERVVPGAVIR